MRTEKMTGMDKSRSSAMKDFHSGGWFQKEKTHHIYPVFLYGKYPAFRKISRNAQNRANARAIIKNQKKGGSLCKNGKNTNFHDWVYSSLDSIKTMDHLL